jgi:hypothetical protein
MTQRVTIESIQLQPIGKDTAPAPPAYRVVVDGKPQIAPLYWTRLAAEEAAWSESERLCRN